MHAYVIILKRDIRRGPVLNLPPISPHFTSPVQVSVASGEGGAWRLSFLPWEGPVLVRMQVEMQDVYNAAGSVRDERMS
ncbi:hypothetical protein PR003_g13439 [Phytophthora rubi]|uniref:Uncharacterized protein n=1 Tax=Phytophthora rubi TaxID=129364 RepID=A0A6A4F6P0_9STRA|nr:hypothetical protein PR001_g12736 [Phytophthora rubi]KAE9334609.1 hypothetical protein PR003_g13439 [Phytophthora rubi]